MAEESARHEFSRPGAVALRMRKAARADLPEELAAQLDRLAAEEPPIEKPEAAPRQANRYGSLVSEQNVSGPAFIFPHDIALCGEVVVAEQLRMLERNFRGWTADEIPWRSPIMAIMDRG